MTDATLLKVIESRNYALVSSLRAELAPLSSDLSKIPLAYEVYRLRTIYPGNTTMNKMVFVAWAARTYHPSALEVTCTSKKGLKEQIAKAFGGCTGRNVSYYLNQARHYYKNVKPFREKVDQLSGEL